LNVFFKGIYQQAYHLQTIEHGCSSWSQHLCK